MAEYRSVASWPPAANWYCGNILAVSRSGWLCWGAKSGLVLAKHNQDQFPTVITVADAHSEKAKVTAVCWCPEEGGAGRERAELLSAAEDGVARVWRLEGEEEEGRRLVLVGQSQTESGRVTCASWSKADPSLVVLGGETGCSLAVWDLMTNTARTLTLGKQAVFSVACHPAQADVVAVGCKLGHLLLVNTQGTGRILSRLRGHEEDVYSLAWSPSSSTKLGETQHEEWLLASSSRDRTVRLWGEREGRPVMTLRLQQDKRRTDHSWVSLCWPSPSSLLSAGAGGELLCWQLDSPARKGGLQFRVLSREHSRNLFTIAAHQDKVFTVGQERLVSVTCLTAGQKLYSLPCLAGFVYCLVSNPIEPGLLAVGGGDGAVRLWRTGDTADIFSVKLVSIRQSKVMSLAWHPTREGLLAAGTDDGKVAWLEVVTGSRQPSVSAFQHRAGVYCLAWLSSKALLSCGDGKIVQHDIGTGKGQELSLGSSQGKSQVVFVDRGDLQLLLVGYEDGSIQVYLHPSLALLVNIKSQSKLIQSLALHPQYLSDGSQADFSQYLASASNEFPVHIFDLSQILEGAAQSEVVAEVLVTPTITLSGHLQRVIELAWAPHDSRLLCSVSYDWSAQVWDVSSGAPLHNFSGHSGRVMCCLWHPTRPGLVITGSEDTTLHIWDPKDQPRQLPIERKKEKKPKPSKDLGSKESRAVGRAELSFDELLALHRSERTKSKSAEKSPVPEDRRESLDSAERGRHFLEARRDKKGKPAANKNLYFPVSSQTEARRKVNTAEDCLSIYQHYQHQHIAEGKDEPVSNGIDGCKDSNIEQNTDSHLGFFTSREAMMRLLEAELAVQSEDPEALAVLSLWSGDLERVVEAAIRTGTVTERLLSHCAGTSQRLWRRAAAAAGQQWVRQGEIWRGAEYLLSAGEVLQAVSVLAKHGHYRPAVAIARSRLPLESEEVREVMRSWARQCQSDGNYSLAAKCWLALGEAGEASEVLAKLSSSSGDQDCLRLAARLAPQAEKAKVYRRQCLAQCLERQDQARALQIIQDDHENLFWVFPLFVSLGHLHRILTEAKERSQPGALLQIIRTECDTRGYDWSSSNSQLLANFVRTNTVRDGKNQILVQSAHLLVSALFTAETDPQSSLGSVASSLHHLSSSQLLTPHLLTEMFPDGVAGGPPVGLALLGRPLDWQCNWNQLRSIIASHAATTINTWASKASKDSNTDINQSDLQDLADAVMLEDVIKRQKLGAEIEEGEDAVAKFFVANIESTTEAEADKTEEAEDVDKEESNKVDLTPSLRGAQTLSLTEDGKWKSEGVSDSVPLAGTEDNMPPPPPPSRSFHDRFLLGRSSNTDALKEIQKLKWTRDRTTAAIEDIPFPDLTEVCKKFLLLMVEKDLGADNAPPETEEDNGTKLSLRKRVARWGYYHGKRCYQEFFIKHS